MSVVFFLVLVALVAAPPIVWYARQRALRRRILARITAKHRLAEGSRAAVTARVRAVRDVTPAERRSIDLVPVAWPAVDLGNSGSSCSDGGDSGPCGGDS